MQRKQFTKTFKEVYDELITAEYIFTQHIKTANNQLFKKLMGIIPSVRKYEQILKKIKCDERPLVKISNWGTMSIDSLINTANRRIRYLSWQLESDHRSALDALSHKKPRVRMFNKTPNALSQIETLISQFNTRFRDRVCEGCDWSTGTYYRKIREFNRNSVGEEESHFCNLSNADKDMIVKVMSDEYKFLWKQLIKYGIIG
jgi:hypothetical protein